MQWPAKGMPATAFSSRGRTTAMSLKTLARVRSRWSGVLGRAISNRVSRAPLLTPLGVAVSIGSLAHKRLITRTKRSDLPRILPEHRTRIVPPEAEGVAQGDADGTVDGGVGGDVEVALG